MSELRYIFKFFINPINSKLDLNRLIEFAQTVSSFFNSDYSKVYYCAHTGNKSRTKSLKYSPDIIEKLSSVEGIITTLAFEKHKKYNYQQDADITLSFFISDKEIFPSSLDISIDRLMFSDINTEDQVMRFIRLCLSVDFYVYSGIMHIMEETKFPMIFLSGFKNPELTQEERDVDDSLCLNISEYHHKIWDTFLFNIIKKELIDNALLQEISNEVSIHNISEFRDYYIIKLPLTFEDYTTNSDKKSVCKNNLRRIFINKGKIMHTPKI